MSITKSKSFSINGHSIPTKIYIEKRKNVRASIGMQHAILRIPQNMPSDLHQEQFTWFITWLENLVKDKPEVLNRFNIKTYNSGDQYIVGNRTYTLYIEPSKLKSHTGKLQNGNIFLKLTVDSDENLKKVIPKLLSNIIGKDFKAEITRKVLELNQLFFQKEIKSISIKYNRSNWGSCSSKSNINLSSRLLFAPDKVINYVIIHELAHLEEMNHSSKFWNLVKQAMPDYKEQEKWLKVHGNTCYF